MFPSPAPRHGFDRGSWRIRDRFGDEWRLALADLWGAAPRRHEHPTWEERQVVEDLVFFSFQHSGALDDEVARVLLKIYDELANERLSEELDRPTRDPRGLLVGFDQQIRPLLAYAVAEGRLRIEKVDRPPWPFLDSPEDSAPPPDDAPSSAKAPPVGAARAAEAASDATEFDASALMAQVAALRAAAATGAPFCEECARRANGG